MPADHFHGARLKLARTFRGLTLQAIGRELDASRQYIQQIENGVRQPSIDVWRALAAALDFDESFFARSLAVDVSEADCTFRARKSTLLSVKHRVAAYASILVELVQLLERDISFPKVRIPAIEATSLEDIESAAEQCRAIWRLRRDAPISRMTRVIENAGAVVAVFERVSERVDALSIQTERPLVILNPAKDSTSRARFDLAHELGHLVLHGARETTPADEVEADRFASAFLLPRNAFQREYPRGRVYWPTLFTMKRRWGVSVAAILRRAYDAGLVDALAYRRGNVHLRRRGWHLGEPDEPPNETPESLSMAFAEVRTLGRDVQSVAEELGVGVDTLERVTGLQFPPSDDPHRNVVSLEGHRLSSTTERVESVRKIDTA
jgi:Zn-dependent peptidase ImmA (M78 family)/transcriptional regulator with XRE-family HTH domain